MAPEGGGGGKRRRDHRLLYPLPPRVFRISFDHLHTLLCWSLEQARQFFEPYFYDNISKGNLDERK